MYFSYSIRKLFAIISIVAVLLVGVTLTLSAKNEMYGESKFGQIIERTLSGAGRFVIYLLKRDGGLANALMITYQNPDAFTGEPAHGLPVLTYHAIIPDKDDDVSPESFEGHNVGLKEFEDQLFALKDNGWETITLKQFDEFMRGERDIPEKSFLLTFDDGAKESYYPVDPLLDALDYEAVTFVLPYFSQGGGTYYYLSQNELLRAQESGRWDVGAHGFYSHTFMPVDDAGTYGAALANKKWIPEENRLERDEEYMLRVREDIALSQDKLEEMFGIPIRTFAFPFGEHGQNSVNNPGALEILRDLTREFYDYTFYQWWEGIGFTYNYPEERSETEMIKRISVHPTWTGEDLLAIMEKGRPKHLPFSDTFDRDTGWLTTWGPFSIEDSKLTVFAAPDAGGASSILDGTRHWKDYNVHLEVESPRQTSVAVLLRFKDNDNHAMCNLGNGFAHVEQIINGERRVIKGERSPSIVIPQGPFTIDASVEGRLVTCSINGQVLVTSEFLDRSLGSGGVGVKVWDQTFGRALVDVDTLTATSLDEEPSEAETAMGAGDGT